MFRSYFEGGRNRTKGKRMTDGTRAAIAALIKADSAATPQERAAIEAALHGQDAAAMPRLFTRAEVARLINRTARMVDYFGKRGLIRRVRLGGASRATGYDAESVKAFIAGTAQGADPADAETTTATTAREV